MRMDDEGRGTRQRRKQADPTCCPVCGITIRSNEIEQHYSLEVDRLHKLSVQKSRKSSALKEMPSADGSDTNSNNAIPCSSSSATSSTSEFKAADGKECWSIFQRIKNNRNARLKQKSRKRKADDAICPVCNERIIDDLNIHVDQCLRRSRINASDDDDDSIDVEGESFEEYEWAGQTRIRASSLLEGGYSAAGIQTVFSASNAEEEGDEDLNVDGDDTQVYGESQYSERDIILPSADDNKKENLYLRNLVIGHPITPKSPVAFNNKPSFNENGSADDAPSENGNGVARTQIECESTASCSTITIDLKNGNVSETTAVATQPKMQLQTSDAATTQIIEALKNKIREYETVLRNKSKCLICMDEFQIPVVSICCWHVHCEECWLRTLGARKLCPQCNMITSPTDLRRIYM